MINMKKLILLSNKMLLDGGDLDVRTVRYYAAMGLISESSRSGRDNMYDAIHVKQLVVVKKLQRRSLSLKIIQSMMDGKNLDELCSSVDLNPNEVEREVAQAGPDLEQEHSQEEESQVSKSTTPVEVEVEDTDYDATAEAATVTITDNSQYSLVQPSLKLGSSFVFVKGLEGDGASSMYAFLYGQKSGPGEVKNAVIPLADKDLILPGCTVKYAGNVVGKVAFILADKDVYKEGTDVARIFLLNPASAGQKVYVSVTLDGAGLDNSQVQIDENGCGILRVPTLVAGSYSVSVAGWGMAKTFEAARYELAPMTAVAKSISRQGNTLVAILSATSFGVPFDREAKVELVEDSKTVISASSHKFDSNGESTVTIDLSSAPQGALSLRITDTSRPSVLASVPLPGTRKDERDETVTCSMGQVTSISLLQSEKSYEERGLHFIKGAANNAPISLKSCVAKVAEFEFSEDAQDVVFVTRDAITGAVSSKEVGRVKKGKTKKVTLDSSLTMIHVGAFVGGKPWEGHAVVLRPVDRKVSVEAPKSIEPGQKLTVTIRAPKKSSVLLKVLDKRMRVQDEPITAGAAAIKAAVAHVLGLKRTGRVNRPADVGYDHNRYAFGGGGLYASSFASFSGPVGATGPIGVQGLTGPSGPTGATGYSGASGRRGRSLMAPSSSMDHVLRSNRKASLKSDIGEVTMCSMSSPQAQCNTVFTQDAFYNSMIDSQANSMDGRVELCSTGASGNVVQTPGIACNSITIDKVASVPIPSKKREARGGDVDLVYCDLLSVSGERTVTITLPDCIGQYDIRAFAVSGTEWSEASVDLSVARECYMEAIIPQVAHEDDQVMCSAYAIGASDAMFQVKVDGREIALFKGSEASWPATPGVHEVIMTASNGDDRVIRVVERPGSEMVLTQELRILRKGETYDLSEDKALFARVLRGLDGEMTKSIAVVSDFGHSCCEQSAAMITAGALSLFLGDDSSRDKAEQIVVKGEARMRGMWIKGKGFKTYPDHAAITPNWSATAGKRLANLKPILTAELSDTARKAITGLVEMGENVTAAHGTSDRTPSPMEDLYYSGNRPADDLNIAALIQGMAGGGYYTNKTEAAFAAASLVKNGRVEDGIKLANAVSKAMGSSMNGGMHGSYEGLSYMHMVDELRKAGIISGAAGSKVVVDGREMTVEQAVNVQDITTVKSKDSSVAVRISRLERIDFTAKNSALPMSIELKAEEEGGTVAPKPEEELHPGDGSRWDDICCEIKPRSGSTLKLIVKLTEGYKDGDVLCVSLPDCVSRVVAGAKMKKFQLDFRGKTSLEVDLVCHGNTVVPQHWSAVVRNMYDSARVGCAGMMTTEVVS